MFECLIHFQILPNVDHVDWIVKTDDDISVDWPTFTARLSTFEHQQSVDKTKSVDNYLFCHMVLQNRLPMRRLPFKL